MSSVLSALRTAAWCAPLTVTIVALAAPARAQAPYLVSDIASAPSASSTPSGFQPFQGRAFFHAYEPVNGRELWKSDGSSAGTVLVKDIQPGPIGSLVAQLTEVNGQLFFSASDGSLGVELWKTDGSDAGTTLVKDIVLGQQSSSPSALTAFQNRLLFQAQDPVHGIELWRSDGTAAGTTLVQDIDPGPGDSYPLLLTVVNGAVFFVADEPALGREVWKTDGTTAGTMPLIDLLPGPLGSYPGSLIEVNGALFFTANDGVQGSELWTSDGTAAGTHIVKDIHPGPGHSASSGAREVVDGILYFVASEPATGSELWRSDGTTAGTFLLADVLPGPASSSIQALRNLGGGILLFVADDGVRGHELWRSDGTSAGTALVADVFPGPASGFVEDPFFADVEPSLAANGYAFFRANEGTCGLELWRSDGTPSGTARIADIRPGPAGSNPREMTLAAGKIFFQAYDGAIGNEAWALDQPQGASFCAADASTPGMTACPCANFGAASHGCANSQSGNGAWLYASGTVQPDAVVLSASEMLPTSSAIFLQGTSALQNGVLFGDGVRCVGGALRQISVEIAVGGVAAYPQAGDPSISAVSSALGDPIAPGSLRYYQVYYRDPDLAFCPAPPGNSWNVTNAIAITW